MLRDNLKLQYSNFFVDRGLIPLGINTFRGNRDNHNTIITLPYKKNGSIVLIATSGWGKSVLVRRIIEYKLKLFSNAKPAIIIDTQGVDHRLMVYQNDVPYPLFTSYGEHPMRFSNVESYAPIFCSNKAYENDSIFGISLNDLTLFDVLSSDINENSANEFFKIKNASKTNRKLLDNPPLFYQEFQRLPASGNKESISAIDYPEDLINYSIKQSLLRFFSVWSGYEPSDEEKPDWANMERWQSEKIPPYFISSKTKYYKPTFWHDYDNNKIILCNFMDAKEQRLGMAIYGGYLLRDAYKYCAFNKKNNPNFNGLFVFVEECNLFIDADDKYLRKGSNFYLTEVLCRGFKFEMEVVASFQSIHASNPHIREYLTSGSNPIIIGNLTKQDRDYLSTIFTDIKDIELRDRIPNLEWGGKEWVVYYNDREYDTFVPYPSMSRYHKRG